MALSGWRGPYAAGPSPRAGGPIFEEIPPAVSGLTVRPGDKLAVIVKHGVLHLVPIVPFEKTKGMHARIDLTGLRDKHDRF